MGDDPVADVEVEDDEHLPVGHSDIQPVEISSYVGGILNRFGHYLVPNLFDLAFDNFDFHENPFFLRNRMSFKFAGLTAFCLPHPNISFQ